MRYHYEKPKKYVSVYGKIYSCNHPVYSRCTLYKFGKKVWQSFSNDSTSVQKEPGGRKSIRGLQMRYIYIRDLKHILIGGLERVRMACIRL